MPYKEEYITLCTQRNDLPLFHKHWWLDIVYDSWDVVLFKKGDNIAGVWPFGIEKKLGVTISRNPALTPYLGPHVFFPKDLKESRKDNYEHEVISELIKLLPPFSVWQTACRPGLKQLGLFKEHAFQANFRQTFLMDLQDTEDVIFSKLHEDFRRGIRRSASEMTITDEPDAISMLYDFQVATLDKKEVSISYPVETIKKLFTTCRQHDACALWVARKEGQVQAILWNMWDDERAYYLVGSKNPQVKDNNAMTALIWQAIKHSKSLGKSSFDFEGSMIPGVERFFRNFGATRSLYPVLQKNTSPLWKLIQLLKR